MQHKEQINLWSEAIMQSIDLIKNKCTIESKAQCGLFVRLWEKIQTNKSPFILYVQPLFNFYSYFRLG